jgi:hypothetical protein
MNIGFVLYRKTGEPGSLRATWCHSELGAGTGLATGGPAHGFAGRYRIRYYDERGDLQAERDLDISREGGRYRVSWLNQGRVTAYGIGLEHPEGLSIGYRDVELGQGDGRPQGLRRTRDRGQAGTDTKKMDAAGHQRKESDRI